MTIKIRLISDVHLEKNKLEDNYVKPIFKQKEETTVCVLAGDIGNPTHPNYKKFLEDTRSKYNYVLLVAGNHEMYEFDVTEMHTYLRSLCIQTGCVYLQRDSIVIDGLEFSGATLWINIENDMITMAHEVLKELEITTVSQRKLTIEGYNRMHQDDLKFIEDRINDNSNAIIITHHPPSHRMSSINDGKTRFYCNSLDGLAKRCLVWCCGHSHHSTKQGNIFSNCVGYKGEFTLFDPNFELTI